MVLALRSTRHPLSDHPDEPLAPVRHWGGESAYPFHPFVRLLSRTMVQGRVRGLQPEAQDDGGEPRA